MVKSAIAALNYKSLFQSKAEVALLTMTTVGVMSICPAHPFVALKRCSAAWVPLRPLYVLKQEFEPMSPKCRHVNATSTQRLPACLQEALRALLARRTSPSLALFFNIADRLYLFFTQISPTEPTCWLMRTVCAPLW